jgi:polyferredoxin
MIPKKIRLSIAVSVFVIFILGMMKLILETSMFMLDRFMYGGGWLQIAILALYGAILAYKMQVPGHSAKWRLRSWMFFSLVFFAQFGLGLLADDRFLMSGKLHLPAPFMIVAGPAYRLQMTIMPVLLLSSIILSGPAWCSHFCYFGAWDGLMARREVKDARLKKSDREPLRNKWAWKWSFLILVILGAIIFRLTGLSGWETLGPALAFAIVGVCIMILFSRKNRKMVHCVAFCPIGTIVNFGKYISPFRMTIESSCTSCMKCIPSCSYDALNVGDIKRGKPGFTCTLCGDCVSSCEIDSIRYRFFKLSPAASRNLYLFITISIHIFCLGLARI